MVASGCVALNASSCASKVRQIPRGPHQFSDAVVPTAVDSKPPPAMVEDVPQAPRRGCVWADGEWLWNRNTWTWKGGRWVELPSDCYYADPSVVWVASVHGTGVLFYTPGQWYSSKSATTCDEPKPCGTPNAVADEAASPNAPTATK